MSKQITVEDFPLGKKLELLQPHQWIGRTPDVIAIFTVTGVKLHDDNRVKITVSPPIGFDETEASPIWYDYEMFENVIGSVIRPKVVSKLFVEHQTIVHVKTGKHYGIVGTPDQYRIEATNQPAYAYREYITLANGEIETGKRVWVRPQTEMEDGRFVLCEQWYRQNRTAVVDPIGPRTREAIKQLEAETYLPKDLPKTILNDDGFVPRTVMGRMAKRPGLIPSPTFVEAEKKHCEMQAKKFFPIGTSSDKQ